MPKKKKPADLAIPSELIEKRIYLVRGQKVMLDNDLAELYDVPTKRLNEQVTRNIDRFPVDFMFQLTRQEADGIRSQIATASRRNIRFRPRAFTEHGILMLSSVLRSERAIHVNITIMRAFVRLPRVTLTLRGNSPHSRKSTMPSSGRSSTLSAA